VKAKLEIILVSTIQEAIEKILARFDGRHAAGKTTGTSDIVDCAQKSGTGTIYGDRMSPFLHLFFSVCRRAFRQAAPVLPSLPPPRRERVEGKLRSFGAPPTVPSMALFRQSLCNNSVHPIDITDAVAIEVSEMTDWSQIVQQHGPLVWRTVCRLLQHEADAADCFQRTFISALEMERTEEIRNWPGLLTRLAIARALERRRQRQRESSRLTTIPEDCVVDRKVIKPGQAAEAAELAEHLRNALAELDERQAGVFCLACLNGLSYQQIAEQLGITVNHVGVLLNRAKASLRERLRSHEPASAATPIEREGQP